MKKVSKIIKYTIMISAVILIIFLVLHYYQVNASNKLEGIENFPRSYQGYLRKLQKNHPNWRFTALYTNLDWNYVIDEENVFGKNLVPKNYSDSWKNKKSGEYNVEIDKGWVDSSKNAVEYCMDPRNFLNEIRIFQFETLSYDNYTNNLNGIEKILYGTEFYNNKVWYLDSNGNSISMNEKYSDLILKAGQVSLVSPYHLASRIKQEVGPFLSHNSISGTVEGFKGLYNFYNIGATSSSEPLGAIKNGLRYAKDGKGASQEVLNKYLIPWNTKERAITGGAIFIGTSYINVGQNTIYLQKFDVNDQRGELFWHQYMTNVLAPFSESKIIYNGYKKSGLLDMPMSFIIPVYENMPDIQTESPDINANDFIKDDTKVYCNSTNVNIRSMPNTSSEIITTVSKDEKMTRLQKGIQTSDKWDRVILEDGIIGYIYSTYVTEVPPIEEEEKPEINKVTEIVLEKSEIYISVGENFTINAQVKYANIEESEILYEVSNVDIANIDENGIITAISEGRTKINVTLKENSDIKSECEVIVVRKIEDSEIYFEEPLREINFEISGLHYNENSISNIKSKIITNLELEVINSKNEILNEEDLLGTGSKIRIKENDQILREYTIILYGDNNGDGKINGIDLLVLQRHILEIEEMKPIYEKASNIRKKGKVSSIDLLLIQRHILEIQFIEQ